VKGQAPFVTMHSSEAASYSNFRFWPEALLASALPQVRLVQTLWHATTDTMLECTTDTTVAGPRAWSSTLSIYSWGDCVWHDCFP
jgi:hypothetical protein